MVEEQSAGDPLATLEPRRWPRTEKRVQIEARRGAIYAARDRGCTWEAIAEALAESGIVTTPNALRLAINEKPRDLKKYPRRLIGRRQKRKGPQSPISKGTMQGGNSDEERGEDRSAAKPEESTKAKPDSDHVIFRRNPNDPI
jgi:hypothetical protein